MVAPAEVKVPRVRDRPALFEQYHNTQVVPRDCEERASKIRGRRIRVARPLASSLTRFKVRLRRLTLNGHFQGDQGLNIPF